jgi:hypothetical protein
MFRRQHPGAPARAQGVGPAVGTAQERVGVLKAELEARSRGESRCGVGPETADDDSFELTAAQQTHLEHEWRLALDAHHRALDAYLDAAMTLSASR